MLIDFTKCLPWNQQDLNYFKKGFYLLINQVVLVIEDIITD